MAYAYRQQTRFCPTIETASVRFPKKIQFNPKCPTVNKCAQGAVTAVSIDSNAVITLTSTYRMEGTDCFRFTVSNVLNNTTYTTQMQQSSSNYPIAAGLFGDLCIVSVSPIINEYACSTCNVLYTTLVPTPPYNIKPSTSNVKWNTPIVPENYGYSTITSFTVSGLYVLSPITSVGERSWTSIAMSSTGQYQTAYSSEGYIYRSSNYGVGWSQITGYANSSSVAMSSIDGLYQLVVGTASYSSSNYGSTWNPVNIGIAPMKSVAMSAAGQLQTAGNTTGNIYLSTDIGVTWNLRHTSTVNESIVSIAMTADGLYQVALGVSAFLYISTTGGNAWVQKAYPTYTGGSRQFKSIAMSEDGLYQTIVGGGYMYTSSNRGDTWFLQSSFLNQFSFEQVAMSSDGRYQVAVSSTGEIVKTTNAWSTWYTSTTPTGSRSWKNVAISSDGRSYQTVTDNNKYLWDMQYKVETYPIDDSKISVTGTVWNLSLSNDSRSVYVNATNMAGTSPYSKPG